MSAIIRFEYGTLAPHELWEAAQAVSDAFAAKHAALGVPAQAAIEVLARAIDPGSAVFAYQGEAFAGVAGLVTPSRRFLRLGLAQALRHLGPGRGLVYYLVARADSRVAEGEVKVQALAVRRGMRGQGIGRRLLGHVEALARDWGCRTLSLDVVDTNTVARRLYALAGFEVVGRTGYGLLTRRAGFCAAYHLRKRIAADQLQ